MTKIFLHIGMHKTGSTAIQSAFDGFDDGVSLYADLGFENHSIPFYTAFSPAYQSYHIWKSVGLSAKEVEARRDDCRAKIKHAVAQMGAQNLIFSGEDISLLPPAAILEIRDLFESHHFEVQVIIYVREPVAFILSNFQEEVKASRNLAVPLPPRYRFRIEKFIEAFGHENVVIRVFDRASLHQNDIVADFAQQIGVNAPCKGKNDNSSLSTEAVKIIYLLNKLIPMVGEPNAFKTAKRRMIEHIKANFPGKFELPEALICGVIDADDVAWLYSISGIDFRRSDVQPSVFSAEALDTFLGELDDTTLAKLRDHLVNNCGVAAPPADLHFLLARYFMSFLDTGWATDFVFDADRYLDLNPDVKVAGVDPYRHYLQFGVSEGRKLR